MILLEAINWSKRVPVSVGDTVASTKAFKGVPKGSYGRVTIVMSDNFTVEWDSGKRTVHTSTAGLKHTGFTKKKRYLTGAGIFFRRRRRKKKPPEPPPEEEPPPEPPGDMDGAPPAPEPPGPGGGGDMGGQPGEDLDEILVRATDQGLSQIGGNDGYVPDEPYGRRGSRRKPPKKKRLASMAERFAGATAERGVWYHGTDFKHFRSIRKKGLIPDPRVRTWASDPDASFRRPSRKSFAGIYVTTNLMTAKASGPGSPGTEALIVVMDLQPRSMWADEDSLTFWLNEVGVPGLVSTESVLAGLYVGWKYGEPLDKKRAAKARRVYITSVVKALLRNVKEPHPKLLTRVTALVKRAWGAALMRKVAYVSKQNWQRAFWDIDSMMDPEKMAPRPDKGEAEKQYAEVTDQLTRTLKRLTLPSVVPDDFNRTARVLKPIGYSGRNRIVALVKSSVVKEGGRHIEQVLYGKVPAQFIKDWKTAVGEWKPVKESMNEALEDAPKATAKNTRLRTANAADKKLKMTCATCVYWDKSTTNCTALAQKVKAEQLCDLYARFIEKLTPRRKKRLVGYFDTPVGKLAVVGDPKKRYSTVVKETLDEDLKVSSIFKIGKSYRINLAPDTDIEVALSAVAEGFRSVDSRLYYHAERGIVHWSAGDSCWDTDESEFDHPEKTIRPMLSRIKGVKKVEVSDEGGPRGLTTKDAGGWIPLWPQKFIVRDSLAGIPRPLGEGDEPGYYVGDDGKRYAVDTMDWRAFQHSHVDVETVRRFTRVPVTPEQNDDIIRTLRAHTGFTRYPEMFKESTDEEEPGGDEPADTAAAKTLARQMLKHPSTALSFRQLWRHKYVEKDYDAGEAWKLFYWPMSKAGAGGKGYNPNTRVAASKLMAAAFNKWAKAGMKAKVSRADGMKELPVGQISRAEFLKWFGRGGRSGISESLDEARKLSAEERKALERMFLGGPEALRTPTYHADTKTIGSLMRKGYFDKRGLTDKGRAAAKAMVEPKDESVPVAPAGFKDMNDYIRQVYNDIERDAPGTLMKLFKRRKPSISYPQYAPTRVRPEATNRNVLPVQWIEDTDMMLAGVEEAIGPLNMAGQRRATFTTDRGMKLKGTTVSIPGFKEFTFVLVPPHGSRAKRTKGGWGVYEYRTGFPIWVNTFLKNQPEFDTAKGAVEQATKRLRSGGKEKISAGLAKMKTVNESLDEAKKDKSSLKLGTVKEGGRTFKTGAPVTFKFYRNTTKAPHMGAQFGQDLEPSGRFMSHMTPEVSKDHLKEIEKSSDMRFQLGTVTFKNPLVLELGAGRGSLEWKKRVSDYYGKTGKALSKALRKDGHDGIVTVSKHSGGKYTSEIVDLTGIKESMAETFLSHGSPPRITPPGKPATIPHRATGVIFPSSALTTRRRRHPKAADPLAALFVEQEPPEPKKKKPTTADAKKAEKEEFDIDDIQLYYDMQIAGGSSRHEATRLTKRQFKIKTITVNPAGRVMVKGMEKPTPPVAQPPAPAAPAGQPPPPEEPPEEEPPEEPPKREALSGSVEGYSHWGSDMPPTRTVGGMVGGGNIPSTGPDLWGYARRYAGSKPSGMSLLGRKGLYKRKKKRYPVKA